MAERERLQQPGRHRAAAAELLDVHVAVHVVDLRHARDPQPPQRREERDPVDHLEHDVDVLDGAALDQPGRAREHRQPAADVVQLEVGRRALDAGGARIVAGDHRHAMAPRDPAADDAVEVGAGAAALRVRPVAVGEDQDVPRAAPSGRDAISRLHRRGERAAAGVGLRGGLRVAVSASARASAVHAVTFSGSWRTSGRSSATARSGRPAVSSSPASRGTTSPSGRARRASSSSPIASLHPRGRRAPARPRAGCRGPRSSARVPGQADASQPATASAIDGERQPFHRGTSTS